MKAIVAPARSPGERGFRLGKMQRDKGARFERLVAGLFKVNGYNAFRTAQYSGKSGDAADVEGVPGIHIECKTGSPKRSETPRRKRKAISP